MAYLFETSGSQLLCGPYGRWLATASPAQIKKALKENEQLQKDWDEKVGDRMIRLCFIGKDINKDFISDIFDTCLDNI